MFNSSIYRSFRSILNSQFSILNSQFSIQRSENHSQFSILNSAQRKPFSIQRSENHSSFMSPSFLPCVIDAEYRGNYVINVRFNDGTIKDIDFSNWLTGGIFEELKDIKKFKKFFIEGMTITWPNGADVAPETLYFSN